ncbi:MAG: UDP-N-acetylmuramoyl-L-alanyl-D-glutamate--2,6-diaminopimelate ligase, partial [Acidimicrobiia bacterium]|nr:UDP-N-acetylmuramoyl-L-alanyl-D-glutamate--2,6-diaminopimelate ligase [Acidimicrobiia bacterium]
MNNPGVTVGALAESVEGRLIGNLDVRISDVVHDSRAVAPGVLFAAIRGFKTDGHRFVDQAISGGASAICVEEVIDDCPVPQIVVDDSRATLGRLAAQVHGLPSSRLRVVGITGTNGKTTVAYLLESIVAAGGLTAGRIGTTGAAIGGRQIPLPRTTPEASDFQRLLADMLVNGVDIVAAEVSSHAMALGRVEAVSFSIAAFTNLSQDHLDFHGNMDEYFAMKARLFEQRRTARAVVNVDDAYGRALADSVDVPVLEIGRDLFADEMELHESGTRFRLVTPLGSSNVSLPLAGSFNVSNALVAAGCAIELGLDLSTIVAGLETVGQIPGRYELVGSPRGFTVVIDYAHTPEGVDAVLEAARTVGTGRLTVVLGAGGDRDQSKRPAMGRAASAADRFI